MYIISFRITLLSFFLLIPADLEETERQWREDFSRWKHYDMPDWKDVFDEYKNTINTCAGANCS